MTDTPSSFGFYDPKQWPEAIRIRTVKAHAAIFLAYVQLHECATIMTERMDDVLDSDEHQTIMREGLECGYKMPNEQEVRARNHLLKTFLAASDPWLGAETKNGLICIPAKTALDLHRVALQSAFMIDDVCRNIRESDYMVWLRTLKQADFPYIGPTSLQEVFNVWGQLVTSMATQGRHSPPNGRGLPINWPKLVF